MVEEKFKIGIDLEVEQSSLDDIARKIQKKIAEATQKGIATGTGTGAGGRAAPGAAATTRSVREAVKVSSKDLSAQIQKAVMEGLSGFEAAAKNIETATNRLTKALEKRGAAAGGPRQALEETRRLASRQQGPTNRNLAREIQASRLEAGRTQGDITRKRTDLRTGTPADKRAQSSAEKRAAFREMGAAGMKAQQKYAEQEARRVAASLQKFYSALEKVPEFKGRARQIAREVGLPGPEAVGVKGGAITLKDLAGNVRIVTSDIKLFGDTVTRVNRLTANLERMLSAAGEGGATTLERAGQVARRRPKLATQMIREQIRESMQGMPIMPMDKPMAPYAMGGKARVGIRLTKEESERVSRLKEEAGRIAEINRILEERLRLLSQEQKAALGIQRLTSVGLTEAAATKARFITEPETKMVKEVEIDAQTLNLPGMGVGGAGAVAQRRMAQVQQALALRGGEMPAIMGRGERAAYEAGIYERPMARHLRTAAVGAAEFPEVTEDMILIDKSVVMDVVRTREKVMNNLAAGLKVGAQLAEGQILGTDLEGGNIVFDAKGVNAQITEIEQVIEDGIEGFRVRIEEIDPLKTGAKLTTPGGMKGIVKRADLAKEYGLPKGTEAAVSMAGMVKRGDIRDAMIMVSSEIAEQVGTSGQRVADEIEMAMREGGLDLVEAAQKVAQKMGLEGFTGGTAVPAGGKLAKAGIQELMMGKIPFTRIGIEKGMAGPAEMGERFYPVTDIRALEQRAETAGIAKELVTNMELVMQKNQDLIAQLRIIAGETDVASEGLRELLPEDFKRLPAGRAGPEEFAGTLVDPDKMAEAFAMRLPLRGGGEELMRVPGIGRGLGQRGAFKTPLGAMGAEKLTGLFDRIAEVGTQIRATRGEIPLEKGTVAATEAAEMANRKIQEMVDNIIRLGVETEEGGAAAESFMRTLMPLVDQLEGAANIQYQIMGKGGQAVRTQTFGGTAGEYVRSRKDIKQQLFAVRDVMGMRAATQAGKFRSVPRAGAVFQDVEMLQKVMQTLGISFDENSEHVQKLFSRLEKLKAQLEAVYASLAYGRAREQGAAPHRRRLMQQVGGGAGETAFMTAIQLPAGVGEELKEVRNRLLAMKEAGANVSAALEALERTAALQPEAGGVAKDIVVMSKEDYEKHVQRLVRRGMTPEAAEAAMKKPALVHRYPTTGGASYMQARLLKDITGRVPAGKIGIPGQFPISGKEDFQKMMGPLEAEQQRLRGVLKETRGLGAAADEARQELAPLNSLIESLRRSFRALTMNLDFDGDKVEVLTQTMDEFGDQTSTAVQDLKTGALSVREIFANIFGESMGVPTGGLKQFGALFEAGMGKLRGPELRRAVLMPETAETTAKEAEALVGGKTAVGLLSDAFNKLALSIIGGSDQMGDAFSTGMERIMLFINESLGGAGAAGPMQFIDDLRKGNLKSIFGKMETGKGVYGDLGNIQKVMRERVEMFMSGMAPDKLMEMVRAAGKEAGDPEEAIQVLTEEMDLKNTIKMMFDMLKENMREALRVSGLDPKEIEAEMQAMLGPKGKGLDLDIIIKNLFPAFAMTRRQMARQMEGMAPAAQAKKALEGLPQQAAEQATKLFATMEPDTKALAQGLIKTLGNWYRQYRRTFEVVSAEQMAQQTGLGIGQARRVGGQFQPETGRTFVGREAAFEPFIKALRTLAEVARGEGPRTQEEFVQLARTLAELPRIVSHEGVHRANKEYSDSVDELVKRLRTGTGALGESADEILTSLTRTEGGLINVRQEFEKLAEMQAGIRTGEVTPGAVAGQRTKAYRVAAEEMLAESADPARLKKLLPDLSEGAMEELMQLFEAVKAREPDLIAAGAEARDRIARTLGTIFNMLTETLQEPGGPGAARAAAEARIADRMGMDFPGRADVMRRRERMSAAQAGLIAGRRAWGIPEEIEIPKGAEDIGGLGDAFRRLFKSAGEAVEQMDPDALRRAEKELNEVGREYQTRLKELQTGPRARPEMAGIQGFNEYMKALVQFRMRASQAYIKQMKQLEEGIQTARRLGQDEVAQEMADKLAELQDEFEGMLAVWRRPVGRRMAHPMMGMKGEPTAGFQDLGIAAPPQVFEDILRSIGGTGAEAEAFKPIASALMQVQQLIEEGGDSTKGWMRMWEALEASPKNLKDNLYKLVEAAGAFGKTMGGAGSAARTNMEEIAKLARLLLNTLAKNPFEGTEEGLERLMQMFPQFAKVVRMGRAGGLAASIEQQYDEALALAKSRAKELTKVIGTDAYKNLQAAGRHFEPMKFDIKDDSGATIQRIQANFKRVGKNIEVSMAQGGAAVNKFGNQMRSALRRVVQWGFASGIVYGTIRAFRALTQTIVEVQNKIFALKKVMDVSVTDFEAMQDSASDMGKEFGIAIEEVLDGMVVYGQQGLKMHEINERTRATLMAVNVTTLDATGATEALTAAHKVFGDQVSSSIEFVDAWAAVAARHAITAKDLADAVKRSGAAAQVAGVGFHDFMGVVTAIGAVTRQTGKEIATGTKFMFRAMRRPTAQKELGKMGIQSLTRAGDFRPAIEVFKELASVWDTLNKAQQVNIAQAMAGIRHYNQFVVLMNNFDEALLASADAANSQGFAVRKNRLAMQTLGKQMQVLRETVKRLGLEVGKAVLPMATSAIKALSGVVEVLNKMPPLMLQVGTAVAAMFIGIHRGTDLVLDSMDAIFGYDQKIGTGVKERGVVKSLMEAPGAFAMGFGAGKVEEGATFMTKTGAKAKTAIVGMGKAAKSAVPGFTALAAAIGATGATAAGILALTGAVAAALVAIGGLIYIHKQLNKSGQEVEQQMEEIIGRSEDAASQLRSQITQADRLSLAYGKLQTALSKLEDPEGLRTALDEGRYKSAALAAASFDSKIADVSNALARLDPTKVKGISETGDYLVGITGGFKAISQSALDAQNAVTASLRSEVIEAFANDLREARGWVDSMDQAFRKLANTLTLGMFEIDVDRSVMGKLASVTKEINEIAELRAAATDEGLTQLMTEAQMGALVEKRIKLEEEALAIGKEIRKNYEAMPTFESPAAAAEAWTPELRRDLEEAAKTGIFGRGVTGGAVATQYMARQAGLGGVVGYEQAVGPAGMLGAFLERGMRPAGGAGQVAEALPGEVAFVLEDVSRAILSGFYDLQAEADAGMDVESLVRRAQMLTSELNSAGDLVYRYYDEFIGDFVVITADSLQAAVSSVEEEGGNLRDAFARIPKKAIEAAAQQTKRIMTLQYTGAMAGIRVPTGGMPELGPARRMELTPEQRMLEAIPETIQRLAHVQAELNQITKEYSEDVLQDVEGTHRRQGKEGRAFKVVTSEILQLTKQLQEEGFRLTVIAHFNKAMQEFNILVGQTAEQLRDAAIEEKIRAKYLVETSGALKGMAEIPSLNLGKTFKELSGLEKLAVEVPGIGELARGIATAERSRQIQVDALIEIDKKLALLEDMERDLATSEKKLLTEQDLKDAELKMAGVEKGTIEMIRSLEAGDKVSQGLMQSQLSIQEQMLASLNSLVEIEGIADPKERATAAQSAFENAINRAEFPKLKSAFLGAGFDMGEFRDLMMYTLRLGRTAEGEYIARQGAGQAEQELAEFATEVDKLNKLMKVYGSQTVPFAGKNIGGTAYGTPTELMQGFLDQLEEVFTADPELFRRLKKDLQSYLTKFGKDTEQAMAERDKEMIDRRAELMGQKIEAQRQAYRAEAEARQKMIDGILQSNKELQAKDPLKLAVAARDFATNLQNVINEFKKTEDLAYTKIGSILEGPGARVGRAGFRTEFEQREKDIAKKYGMGPLSVEDYKARAKELADLEYDIKESKIKELQNVETEALRREQQQAERFRSTIYEALEAGALTGMPELEGMAKRFMDVLGDELVTAEQGEMRGGKLYFKGVPSLERAEALVQRVREAAVEKAREAQTKLGRDINKPLDDKLGRISDLSSQSLSQQQTQTQYLAQIAGATTGTGAAVGPGAAGAPAVLGVPGGAVGGAAGPGRNPFARPGAMGRAAGGPALSIQEFADMLMQAHRGAPGVERLGRDLGQQISKTIYTGDIAKRPGMFVREQMFRPRGAEERGLTAGELSRGIRNALESGARVFRPTGALAGQTQFTDRPELHAQGATNWNLMQEMGARRKFGADYTAPDTVARKETGDIPGTGRDDRREPRGAAEAQAEASQTLADAVASLQDTLAGLTERGLQVDNSPVVTAVETTGGLIVDAIAAGSEVTIANDPLSVIVANIEDIGTTAVAGVGAQVDALAGLIQSVESNVPVQISEAVLEVQSELEGQIAAVEVPDEVTSLVDRVGTLETAAQNITTLATNIDANATEVNSLIRRVTDLESGTTNLETAVSTIDGQVAIVETRVVELEGELNRLNDLAQSANSQAQQAWNIAQSAKRV